MSLTNQILTAMRPDCVYRPCDLAPVVHLQSAEVGKILRLLARGGLVDNVDNVDNVDKEDGYRRKATYKTRQNDLFR